MALDVRREQVDKSAFETDGFVVLRDWIAPAELEEARAALRQVLSEADGLEETTERFSIAQGDDGRPYVRRIFNPIDQHPMFMALMRSPRILDVVETVLGSKNITLHHTKLNLKPPSRHSRFEWHQDYPFAPQTNYDMVAVMIYLDDSTEENGCLTVIPGSHKLGPQVHVFAADGAFSTHLLDETIVKDQSVWSPVVVPAGGISVHHCNLLHSSAANRTTKPRSTLICQYRAADTLQLFDSGHTLPAAGFGMLLRGSRPYEARFLDGTIVKLPPPIDDPVARDG